MAEPITNVLGTVAIKHCGEYNASMIYEKLNVVTYQGSSYCAKGPTQGNLPTNTTYWDLMAEKGDKGDTGATPVKGVDYYTASDIADLESTLSDDVTTEVSDQLSTLTSATPLVASSTADMTDTTRIYVLTTDGHWYWHDGEDWQDGGTYQASEDSNQVKSNLNRINGISDLIGVNITNDFNFTDGYQIIAESSNANYGLPVASTNFKCSGFTDISGYKILDIVAVVRKYSATAYTGLCFYDKDKVPISGLYYTDNDVSDGYTLNKSINIPSEAKYIRTTLYLASSTVGQNTTDFICYAYKSKVIDEIDENKDILESIGLANGYMNKKHINFDINAQVVATDGTIYSSNNYVCTDYIKCEKYDSIKLVMVVRVYTENAHTGIAFYDENKTYISGKSFTDSTAESGYNQIKEIGIPTNAKYFRTTLFSENSSHGTNDLPFNCELYTKSRVFNEITHVGYEIIDVPYYPHHDATVVGNEIWAFNKPSDGNSKIYDLSFNFIKNINVNLVETLKNSSTEPLQMKSVDFNNNNNVLLVGNGRAGYSSNDSYIYAFYDAKDWKNAPGEINFSNCGYYSKIDVTDLGVKSYGFWAGIVDNTNDQIYVSVNEFRDIYLIRLGKGTTQLSGGTYEYIDDNKYNGTYSVLEHWKQESNMTGDFAPHGGQAYNGRLYIVNNDDSKNEIYQCILTEDGKLKFNVIQAVHYLRSGVKQYRNLDGMFIKDGYIYSAPLYIKGNYHSGDNKVVLKIKLND